MIATSPWKQIFAVSLVAVVSFVAGCDGGNREVNETSEMTFEQLAAEADAETEASENDL